MTGIIPKTGHRGAVVVLDAAGVIGRGLLAAALEAGLTGYTYLSDEPLG